MKPRETVQTVGNLPSEELIFFSGSVLAAAVIKTGHFKIGIGTLITVDYKRKPRRPDSALGATLFEPQRPLYFEFTYSLITHVFSYFFFLVFINEYRQAISFIYVIF